MRGARGARPRPDDEGAPGSGDLSLLWRYTAFLKPHKGLVLWSLGTLSVSLPFVVVGPDIIRRAVDGPIAQGSLRGLGSLILVLLGAGAVEFVMRAWHQWVLQLLGQRVMSDLRRKAFDHLMDLSPGYYDKTPTGWLVTRITSDIETMNQLLTQGLVVSLGDIASLVVIAGYLFAMNPALAGVTLATMPVMFWIMLRFRPKARAAHREARTALARISGHLHESCAGVRAIKALRAEARAESDMRTRTEAFRDANLKAVRLYSVYFPSVDFTSWVAIALLLFVGGQQVAAGTLTYGGFFAFWLLAKRFFEPIRQLTNRAGILQSALTGAERLGTILDTPPAITDPAQPAVPAPQGPLEFRDVTFDYGRGGDPVLRGVSFRAEPGQTLALVGHTGAGKSTVLALCARFYDTVDGAVSVADADVRAMSRGELRRRMAYAPQDPMLVGETVGEAIGFGGPDGGRSRGDAVAEAALRRLGAGDLLERLPDGVQTRLDERGENLSAGERQICSLARALAADTPILLLDEALSQVDPETEARALAGLRDAAEGRIVLVAAHRLATIQDADQILLFHKGRLEERGTHQQLIALDGRYRRLYDLQRLDALLAEGGSSEASVER